MKSLFLIEKKKGKRKFKTTSFEIIIYLLSNLFHFIILFFAFEVNKNS